MHFRYQAASQHTWYGSLAPGGLFMARQFFRSLIAVSLVCGILAVGDAQAAQIHRKFAATGSEFYRRYGPESVILDPLTFVFTINFDNSGDYSRHSEGLTMQSDPLNMPIVTFGYWTSDDTLSIGPWAVPAGGCTLSPGDGCLAIFNATSASPQLYAMVQAHGVVGDSSLYQANRFALSFIDITTASVPEPATWAMMLFGFGAAGGAMRYRRRRTTMAYAS
jgi:PEP-CTERM motif